MPIWLRNFTIKQIIDWKNKENKAMEKATKGKNITSTNIGDPVPEHMKKILNDTKRQANYTTQRAKK